MLQISAEAAAVLSELRVSRGIPETYGLRIYSEAEPEGQKVQVTFTESPEEGDHVSEQRGTKLFIAEDLATPLSEAFIDVEPEPEGASLVIKNVGQP